ncbi:MAG: ATP-binding protein, partial [Gammaproteobacteria bacterium]|nr:ATP-binding protein [Gammaproteobacteria bacterium]
MSHEFPYPGLRPFERDETDIFFGREDHTDQLLEKLGQNRFLAVVGPSGCGKSSLVRTGLLAGLEGGLLSSAGIHWRIAEMRPGNHPFANLAEALLDEPA